MADTDALTTIRDDLVLAGVPTLALPRAQADQTELLFELPGGVIFEVYVPV